MEREAEDAIACHGDLVESGGYLYALEPLRGGRVALVKATGPGCGARHGRHRLHLSSPELVEADFSETLRRAELVRVGCFHSHSEPSAVNPSEVDLEAWAASLDDTEGEAYVGLILVPHSFGFNDADVYAWAARRDAVSGHTYVEPAVIEST
jgi:hypothetical protein